MGVEAVLLESEVQLVKEKFTFVGEKEKPSKSASFVAIWVRP